MMDDWVGGADQVIKKLATANTKLETAVADIKNKVKLAQNVVKVIRLLDEAVVIAMNVMAA
jgi:hypothetical protein